MNDRIFLVDDHESLLDTLTLAFENERFVVSNARDGVEAFALLEREPFALLLSTVPRNLVTLLRGAVLSYVNMPRLDGLSLCRRVRAVGLALPIPILSSRDSEIDEALGLDLNADDCVAKPFSRLEARVGVSSGHAARRGASSCEASWRVRVDAPSTPDETWMERV